MSCAFVQAAFAQENPMDLFADGAEAFEAGNYDEALVFLDKAIALEPNNSEFHYLKALALSKTGEADQALITLNSLVEQNPDEYRKALFDIGAIYSQQSQHEKALQAMELAIRLDPQDPRAYMEAATVQRSLERYPQAFDNLDKAVSLDPKAAPTANLIMASIYLEQEEFDKAEEFFRKAGELGAGTPVAEASVKSLKAVEQTRRARKPWFANGQFVWGYDDNVSLQPLESITAQAASDKEDAFQNLYAEAGYRIINRKDFRLGGILAVNTQGYQDLAENNILSYNPTAFMELLKKDKYYLRFSYDFSYYYTGGQDRDMQDMGWYLLFDSDYSKLKTHRLMPTLTIYEPHGLSSVLSFAWMQKDYCDITPDAHSYLGGIVQNWTLPKLPVTLRAGYQHYWEDAEISNYSYYSHTGLAGLSWVLPWDLVADAQYTYVRTHFDESPQIWSNGQWYGFWEGDRKDSLHGFGANLSKKINDRVMLIANYYHGENDSNVSRQDPIGKINGKWQYKDWDPYEFRKNLFSLAVSCNF